MKCKSSSGTFAIAHALSDAIRQYLSRVKNFFQWRLAKTTQNLTANTNGL